MENEGYYKGSKTVIYKMSQNREVSQAFEAIWEACQTFTENKGKFIKLAEKSRWFKIINRVIKKALMIHQALIEVTQEGLRTKNVLIYCQSGSGVSCLLSSLA